MEQTQTRYMSYGTDVVAVRVRPSAGGCATELLINGDLIYRAPTRYRRTFTLAEYAVRAPWQQGPLGRAKVVLVTWSRPTVRRCVLVVPGEATVHGVVEDETPAHVLARATRPAPAWL